MSYQYNLGVQFYEIAKEYGKKTALKYSHGVSTDFSTLNEFSNQIGNFFSVNGIRKGDVIAIFNEKRFLKKCT